MSKQNLDKLKHEIENCKKQLRELQPYIYSNAAVSENFNRILIKKAILVDKYEKLTFKKSSVAAKISNFLKFKKHPKLICDYFLNS